MQVDEYLDEGLLQQVVHIVGSAHALDEQAADRFVVAVEKVFKCRIVAVEYQRHQPAVVGYDIVGYLHTRLSLRMVSRLSSIAPGMLSTS